MFAISTQAISAPSEGRERFMARPAHQARAEAVSRATYPSRIPIPMSTSSSSRAMLKKTTIGTSV